MPVKQLTLAQLVDKLAQHEGKNNFAFFLGAGASKSAGIPLASEMINEWIVKVYPDRSGKPIPKISYASDGFIQALPPEVDAWAKEYKKKSGNSISGYGFWFEEAYSTPRERQEYIEDKINKAIELTPEYYLLAQLIEKKVSHLVVTVNFDDLVAESIRFCNSKKPLVIYDNSLMWNAGVRTISTRPVVLKIHGDYMVSTMSNTDKEKKELPSDTTEKLDDFLGEVGLVVIGYGGNDQSVMSTLTNIARKRGKFPYGIYWCTFGEQLPTLSQKISDSKVEFFHIPKVDFWDFALTCQRRLGLDTTEKLREKVNSRIATTEQMLKDELKKMSTAIPVGEETIEAIKRRAEIAYFGGFYAIAIIELEKLAQLAPDDPDLYLMWGVALGELGVHEEAIKKFKKTVELKPVSENYYNLGTALGKAGEYEEAAEIFKKAFELNPNSPDVYDNWGIVLGALGKIEESIEKHSRAIELDPNDSIAYYNLGVVLGKGKRYAEAIEKFSKAIVLNPDYAEAHNNLGAALSALKRHEEAVEVYRKAITVSPNKVILYVNLGLELRELGKHKEAVEILKKVIEQKPEDASASYNLACEFSLLKQKDDALAALEKTISLDTKYKAMAKTDKDFEWLWDDEDFKRITKE